MYTGGVNVMEEVVVYTVGVNVMEVVDSLSSAVSWDCRGRLGGFVRIEALNHQKAKYHFNIIEKAAFRAAIF